MRRCWDHIARWGFALGLLVTGAGQVAAAGHPTVHVAKPPQMHFSAPKMPQMHFSPPRVMMPKPPASMAHLNNSFAGGNPFLPKPAHTSSRPVKPAHSHVNIASTRSLANTAATTTNTTPNTTSTSTTAGTTSGRTVVAGRRVGRPHHFYNRYHARRGYGRYYRPTNRLNGPMLRLQRLIADLDSLGPKTQVTQIQKNMLKNDLMAVAEAAPKPTTTPVQQLANDLADAMVGRRTRMLNTMELAGDLKAVMNGAHLAPGDVNQAMAESQTLLKGSGVQQAQLQAVVNDLKAVAASLPRNMVGQAQVR